MQFRPFVDAVRRKNLVKSLLNKNFQILQTINCMKIKVAEKNVSATIQQCIAQGVSKSYLRQNLHLCIHNYNPLQVLVIVIDFG